MPRISITVGAATASAAASAAYGWKCFEDAAAPAEQSI